jgi:26S proteasome regulatory subunit N3
MAGRLHEARTLLHGRLRTSTLRHDSEGQAMLLNLLLRNYIHYNLYEQAEKLISKTTFPENANNNESARYLFYLGKIKATQLDYSEAFKNLNQAIRKAPQNAAIGFKQAATKLLVVVQLLLGEVPERHIFRDQHLRLSLQPYLQLTQAVLAGDLGKFSSVLERYSDKFMKEGTLTLINRLRHNVIKTGWYYSAIFY